jgi:hypothetical protein
VVPVHADGSAATSDSKFSGASGVNVMLLSPMPEYFGGKMPF